MSNITPFMFDSHQVRVVTGADGEPWVSARDVAEALEYPHSTLSNIKRLTDHVPAEWKGRYPIPTLGGEQESLFLSEQGVYFFVGRSDKPKALPFQKWVAGEVLPSIRKNGGYIVGQEEADEEELMAKALQVANAIIERKKAELSIANDKLAKLKPKGDFYDAVTGSKDAIDLGAAAKVLNMGFGRNKLFSILRQKKILQENNLPYQEQIDAGRFRVIEQRYSTPNGETHIGMKTVVYQRGLDYIRRKISAANSQS